MALVGCLLDSAPPSKLTHVTRDCLRCSFKQDYVQEWVFYGATFFTVEQRQFKDYPSPLTLGINCEGVLLMHPEKKVRCPVSMSMALPCTSLPLVLLSSCLVFGVARAAFLSAPLRSYPLHPPGPWFWPSKLLLIHSVLVCVQTVLENYQYTDIVTWGHSDEKFIVVVRA